MGFRVVQSLAYPAAMQVEQADPGKETKAGERMASALCSHCGKVIALDSYVEVNRRPIHLACTKEF